MIIKARVFRDWGLGFSKPYRSREPKPIPDRQKTLGPFQQTPHKGLSAFPRFPPSVPGFGVQGLRAEGEGARKPFLSHPVRACAPDRLTRHPTPSVTNSDMPVYLEAQGT